MRDYRKYTCDNTKFNHKLDTCDRCELKVHISKGVRMDVNNKTMRKDPIEKEFDKLAYAFLSLQAKHEKVKKILEELLDETGLQITGMTSKDNKLYLELEGDMEAGTEIKLIASSKINKLIKDL